MNYFVYIVECCDSSLYTGITTDIKRRIRQHNGEIVGGAIYTKARRPVSIKHSEEYSSRSAAQKRECKIKKLTRREKLALINSNYTI